MKPHIIDLIISSLIAIGTVGAVVVALFRDLLKLKPKLVMDVHKAEGHSVSVSTPSGHAQARYYHLAVSNSRRGIRANGVQVFLTHIQEQGPDDRYKTTWLGNIPMRWRYQEVHPLQRDIGATIECDLCSVVEGQFLRLETLLQPEEMKREWEPLPKIALVVTFQARAIETDSNEINVRIAWNGKWANSDQDILRHIVVEKVKLKPDGSIDQSARI